MIKVYTNQLQSGDWYKVYRNGSLFYEGHDISFDVYCEMLKGSGCGIEQYALTDLELDELGIYLENPS